jgi:hypothetical protein
MAFLGYEPDARGLSELVVPSRELLGNVFVDDADEMVMTDPLTDRQRQVATGIGQRKCTQLCGCGCGCGCSSYLRAR